MSDPRRDFKIKKERDEIVSSLDRLSLMGFIVSFLYFWLTSRMGLQLTNVPWTISLRRDVGWPARSPDLSIQVYDFFLWGGRDFSWKRCSNVTLTSYLNKGLDY